MASSFAAGWMRWITALAPFLFLITVWYLGSAAGIVDPIFLPSPAQVVDAFVQLMGWDFIQEHLLVSSLRIVLAFLLSLAIAFPLGVLCGQIPSVARLVEPLCGFTRYLPVAALVPLCILWFGIDNGQKVAVITIGVMFQLVLLFAADTASVPHELIEAGRTFGLGRAAVLRRIVLPWSMPALWDDMRVSAGWAWSYLVLAELVAGNRGIGYFIIQSQRFLETERVFAGILLIGILGLATDLGFRLAGRRLFRWQ